MTCSDVEILICDYLDGTLAPAERAEFSRHLESCGGCAELARDAAAALRLMERAADVEPPPELINRILFQVPRQEGRTHGWVHRFFGPVLQPRFAMGMAMTVLSLAMLSRFVAPVRQLRPSDLNPSRVWASVEDRAARSWERTIKFYESIRFVYQIQSSLREWNEQQEADQRVGTEQKSAPARTDEHRADVKQSAAPEQKH
jgi:hypothetical protein